MSRYKVRLMKRAYQDLDSIYSYIAHDKLALENARNQVHRIKSAILGLDTFPQSHQDRLIGRYAEKNYKQLIVDNYIVIFRIDESEKDCMGCNNQILWEKSVITVCYG